MSSAVYIILLYILLLLSNRMYTADPAASTWIRVAGSFPIIITAKDLFISVGWDRNRHHAETSKGMTRLGRGFRSISLRGFDAIRCFESKFGRKWGLSPPPWIAQMPTSTMLGARERPACQTLLLLAVVFQTILTSWHDYLLRYCLSP